MALPPEHLLDELATAYIQSVAAIAGAVVAENRDYGVDGTLKPILKLQGDRYVESGYPVDFQLKSTTSVGIVGSELVYDLKARNYNLLVERRHTSVPFYLFLVVFPPDPESWVVEEPERLILSASAYYWTPTGAPSANTSSVRVRLPTGSRLTARSLTGILDLAKSRLLQ